VCSAEPLPRFGSALLLPACRLAVGSTARRMLSYLYNTIRHRCSQPATGRGLVLMWRPAFTAPACRSDLRPSTLREGAHARPTNPSLMRDCNCAWGLGSWLPSLFIGASNCTRPTNIPPSPWLHRSRISDARRDRAMTSEPPHWYPYPRVGWARRPRSTSQTAPQAVHFLAGYLSAAAEDAASTRAGAGGGAGLSDAKLPRRGPGPCSVASGGSRSCVDYVRCAGGPYWPGPGAGAGRGGCLFLAARSPSAHLLFCLWHLPDQPLPHVRGGTGGQLGREGAENE